MPVHPQIAPVLRFLSFLEKLRILPLERMPLWLGRRFMTLTSKQRAASPSACIVENKTVTTDIGRTPIRVYKPANATKPLPVLVYFHGGGWVLGNLDSHDANCRSLCLGADVLVVSVDYRLAPEHPFPAAIDDCYAVTRWLSTNAASLGGDPSRLAVSGDSAGGNLAAATALLARDRGGPKIAFQLLVYPVADADFERPSYRENASGYLLSRSTMMWFWDQYVPDKTQRKDDRCAPIHAQSLANLPPALIITAEYDPLRDEGEAYAERLRADGVPVTLRRYDGMIHGFFGNARIDDGKRALEEANEALRSLWR